MSDRPALAILVVDDSPEDRELYRRLLSEAGAGGEVPGRSEMSEVAGRRYRFLEADSGEEGLKLALAERPDCVLLDYRLPDLDGLEFLSRLAEAGGSVPPPVIVLTGQGNEAVAVQAMKGGAQDYLLKDAISQDGLTRAVAHAIEKVALRRKVLERTAELARANEELVREIGERRRAEEALQHTYAELEKLVAERTAELARTNEELMREIRERERAELERARLLLREQVARQQAEEANRMKDEFLATLSHELRTPLNAMLGWVQVLRTGKLDESTGARALETIERNARAQAQLIADLLDVSRIITGKLRLEMKPVELPRVVEAALDGVRPAADAKAIQVAVTVDRLSTPVLGDADRLQQVAWNLLSNAIKFTPRGGRVSVEVVHAGANVELRVSDSGIGIRPDFLPYVFDRFRQAESTTTRAHGGLGLGLSIVRHLVELHGGSVHVESEGDGRGASFAVRLPAQAAASVETVAEPRPGASGWWEQRGLLSGLSLLVVDDEVDARDLLVMTLSHCGARVTATASAAEALAALDGAAPDVLVSDIGMPGTDGYALLRELRLKEAGSGRRLPAAALTAYARSEDRLRALAAGFQAHLAKPIDPAELVAVVARLAGRLGGAGAGRIPPGGVESPRAGVAERQTQET